MARRGGEWWRWRGAKWCSYKKATVAVCCVNLVIVVFVVRSLFGPFHTLSPPVKSNPFLDFKNSEEQMRRVEESNRLRKEAEPVEIVKLVKGLRKEISGKERRRELSPAVREMITDEILESLRGVKNASNVTEQREAVELWRIAKLKAVKRIYRTNATSASISAKEAKALKGALESDWYKLSEEMGLWIPDDIVNKEIDDKPENGQDLEEDEEIIPGPPLPPECHAEPHTDYDGSAVRWGLTHHKDSAADCCQACLDQAKQAKPGETKCNIWVYCPSEFGCFSPDIYEHKHQECWLKQAQVPRVNFKSKYSESYRNNHPTAPVVVPWISGVTSA